MNLYLSTKQITKFLRRSLIINPIRFSSTSTDSVEQTEKIDMDDSDEQKARREEIERKRNISRLSHNHYKLVHDRPPYDISDAYCLFHLTERHHRRMFGKYGAASGVDPSLCWPRKTDIEETKEYESVAYPFTIKEMMDAVAEKRQQERLRMEEREKQILIKYSKLKQWKKELKDRVNKKAAAVEAAKNKKAKIVEEVRREFGFQLDPKDERFQEMLAKKEKQQRKLEKEAKREAKEKMMLAKLLQNNAETSEDKAHKA